MENNNQKPIPVDKKTQKKIRVVQTYAEDMAKVIESGEGGIIKKIIHEQEEIEAEKKNLSPESKKNKTFMMISMAFIFLALVFVILITVFRKQIFTVTVVPQFTPIIFTDKMEFKEIAGFTKDKIAEAVKNETIATKVKAGGVEGIYLTENKKAIGFGRFIALIKGNVAPEQISFIDDNFLLGIANKDTTADGGAGKNLFILLKVRSFADVFPVMKNWENKMFYDLHGFFGADINADTNYLLTKNFEDGIVNNKNARILRDKTGNTVLEYVFADDTSVIITNSDQAAKEVMLRLASGQIKK